MAGAGNWAPQNETTFYHVFVFQVGGGRGENYVPHLYVYTSLLVSARSVYSPPPLHQVSMNALLEGYVGIREGMPRGLVGRAGETAWQ